MVDLLIRYWDWSVLHPMLGDLVPVLVCFCIYVVFLTLIRVGTKTQ